MTSFPLWPGTKQSRQQSIFLSAWDYQCRRWSYILSRIGFTVWRDQGQTPRNFATTEPKYWPIGPRCWADSHYLEISERRFPRISGRSTSPYDLYWEPSNFCYQNPEAPLWSTPPRANDQTKRWSEESRGNHPWEDCLSVSVQGRYRAI